MLLCDAYTEDEMNGEKRVVLRFAKNMAPVKAAVRNKQSIGTRTRLSSAYMLTYPEAVDTDVSLYVWVKAIPGSTLFHEP
jgi:hypothetical protein